MDWSSGMSRQFLRSVEIADYGGCMHFNHRQFPDKVKKLQSAGSERSADERKALSPIDRTERVHFPRRVASNHTQGACPASRDDKFLEPLRLQVWHIATCN